MIRCVLDASVLVAVLNRERGYERMVGFLWEGAISTLNLSEVVAKLLEYGLSEVSIRQDVGDLGLTVIAFDEALAFRAAALRAVTRRAGLSLADRACLATAQNLGAVAVTADHA